MDRRGGDERDGVEVGVGEHEARRLPAELEHGRLRVSAQVAEDLPGGGGAAGEADLLHERVADERLAGLGGAGQHVDDTGGDAGLADQRP